MPRVSVIGSGFSGFSAACYMAAAGCDVTVLEKQAQAGGRARSFSEQGFLFDMGPSWYWMPDVFERFFKDFGHAPADYYQLVKLSPSFQIFFKEHPPLVIPAEAGELPQLFESIEPGSAKRLQKFMAEGELKYRVAMRELIYKPAHSWLEFASPAVAKAALQSHLFKSMRAYVRSFFKDERLAALMEFPVIFLGAMPDRIPALYSLMNYAAFSMGTWYPMGGMRSIIDGMQQLATELGVEVVTNTAVEKIAVVDKKAIGLNTSKGLLPTDAVIATADYRHVEKKLLEATERNYDDAYWENRTLAPSCLIFYLGINKKVKGLLHHNLFFDADLDQHAAQIYTQPQWPADPLFYVCCPSKTDPLVAPQGMENLFVLVPVAAGLADTETQREAFFDGLIQRIEKHCGDTVAGHIIYKRSYSLKDFEQDYNAYKGNAYGLANTLGQTAVLKPKIKNRQVGNLFYAGQLTVPGPGVPPALISGQIAAGEALKYINKFWQKIK